MPFLDKEGLAHFWNQIIARLNRYETTENARLKLEEAKSYTDNSIPTKVTDLENDAEYITADALSDLGGGDMLKATYDKDGDGVVDNAEKLGGVAASEYAKKTDVPTVPTNVGAFTNDAGYLTSYTETDPTVPSHVKGITTGDITNWNAKATTNYVDTKVAGIVDTAPTTLDTLKEIADAMEESAEVVEALDKAIGTKANASDLTAHTGNKSNPHGVTKAQVGLGNVDNTADKDKNVKHADSADTATSATNVANGGEGISNVDRHIWFSDNTTETKRNYKDSFVYNPATDTIKATNFSGNATTATTADNATKLSGISLGTSGSNANMIKLVYEWTISSTYAGCAGLYAICDDETQFNGILSVRFRNTDSATKLGEHELAWIAASRTPPKAVLTYTINESSITYRLYIYYGRAWRTLCISKITEIGTAGTLVNSVATELAGTTLQEATYVKADTATSATKLATARTIALHDGVAGTATSFDGTSDISIPVTSVKEAFLGWGGRDIAGSFSALDAALIEDLGANRLAGLGEDKVVCERSSDAGSTWTTYTPGGGTRAIVTTSGNACNANTTDSQSVNNWHRITIDVNSTVYCELRKIAIYFSTNGATGTQCKVEWGDYSSTTVWTPVKTVNIAGWSGWNIINVSQTIGSSSYEKVKYVRLTFSQTGVNSSYSSNSIVQKIRFYSNNYWGGGSFLASTGHLYRYDADLNATFPGSIYSPKAVYGNPFYGDLKGNADTASKVTIHDSSAAGVFPIMFASEGYCYTPTSGIGLNPSTGNIVANNFYGALKGNADTATKATQDGNGNNIVNTYATKSALNSAVNDLSNAIDNIDQSQGKDGNGNDIVETYATKGELSGKANSSHTHTKSQITDFPTSLPASDVYSWAKASSKPSYSWSEITGKPSTFTPASHTHAASEISGCRDISYSCSISGEMGSLSPGRDFNVIDTGNSLRVLLQNPYEGWDLSFSTTDSLVRNKQVVHVEYINMSSYQFGHFDGGPQLLVTNFVCDSAYEWNAFTIYYE